MERSAADRASLKDRLTARYEHSFDRKLLEGLPLFVTAEGDRVDFFEIKRRAAREAIFALDAEADVSDFRTRRRFVLLLSAREKRFFQNALDLSFSEPPRRVSLLTAGHRINERLRTLRERLRGAPRILDEGMLSAAELLFQSRLSSLTGRWDEVVFVDERELRTVQETDSGKADLRSPAPPSRAHRDKAHRSRPQPRPLGAPIPHPRRRAGERVAVFQWGQADFVSFQYISNFFKL